jgi:hypothetical protein
MEKVRRHIDSASSEHGGVGATTARRYFGRWRAARLLDARKERR